ncbi:MAG: mannonate dehydratase [Pseudoruegeria sp.]
MPQLHAPFDWMRTKLDAPLASGGHALRFSQVDMAGFEGHMLQRSGAEADYTPEVLTTAESSAASMDDTEKNAY